MVGKFKNDITNETKFSTLLTAENPKSDELDSLNSFDIKHIPILNKPSFGDEWTVYVSHLNTLKYFHVQNAMNYEYIQSISSVLDKYDSTSKKLPKVGNLVAARATNGIWYRAKVQSITDSGLYICFIDFGISKYFVTDFKHLPKELVSVIPMAYRCYFNCVSKEDEDILSVLDLLDSINSYYNSNQLTAKFLSKNEPYLVTLSHNNKNVFDILSDLIWDGIYPSISDDPITIAKRKMLNKMCSNSKIGVVCVEPIISRNHFYVETEFSNQISKSIRAEIENKKKWVPVLIPKAGKIVIAKNTKDLKLYRARIIQKNVDCEEHKCFLIDCGTFENCSEMFEPCDYLLTAPPVKIHCSLDIQIKFNDNILESMNLSFIDEISECNDKLKTMNIKKIGSPCVINLEMDGLNIIELIKPCEVRIINVLNFNEFKVRLNSRGAQKILSVLKSTKHFFSVPNPEFLELYVAKIGTEYKRVKCMGEFSSGFSVILEDEIPVRVTVKELFALPKSLINVKTTDLYCSMGLNPTAYSNPLFIDIINKAKATFKMVIIKNNYVDLHIVKLFFESKDVTSMICNQPSK